ncbi:hypothetical protein Hanom_Chr08g00721591 [Helianthus anomalus]
MAETTTSGGTTSGADEMKIPVITNSFPITYPLLKIRLTTVGLSSSSSSSDDEYS